MPNAQDLTTRIMFYEAGDFSTSDTVILFSDLVRLGLAWSLQGTYGRIAQRLIDTGILDQEGNIDWEVVEELTGVTP